MAYDYARIREITTLPSSAGNLITNPSSTKTFIRLIVLHNTNTTAETVRLWNVPDSGGSIGTAADGSRFYKDSLEPDETVFIELPQPGLILEHTNDTIQGDATTASKVTMQACGATE